MSKVEIVLYLVVSFALACVCAGQGGWLFELGLVFSGALVGAVAWHVLNERGE